MSTVTRLSDMTVNHEVTEGDVLGDTFYYRTTGVTGPGWRCDGCGNIWAKKWYAATCEERGHRNEFDQKYFYRPPGFLTHGHYEQKIYTRHRVGRDRRIPRPQEGVTT